MTELREFARHNDDLTKLRVLLVPISVDDQRHSLDVWENAGDEKFVILSDPGAQVIRKYGLLHERGHTEPDIALRATLLIDPDGREKWRRVSRSVSDIPGWDETFAMIKKSQGH